MYGGDFAKFCGLLIIYKLYKTGVVVLRASIKVTKEIGICQFLTSLNLDLFKKGNKISQIHTRQIISLNKASFQNGHIYPLVVQLRLSRTTKV